jgi:hypothetical protein
MTKIDLFFDRKIVSVYVYCFLTTLNCVKKPCKKLDFFMSQKVLKLGYFLGVIYAFIVKNHEKWLQKNC